MADRIGATTVEIEAGHLSLITHSDQIAELILDAAAATTVAAPLMSVTAPATSNEIP